VTAVSSSQASPAAGIARPDGELAVAESGWWAVDRRAWDAFAKAHGASFLAAAGNITRTALRHRVRAFVLTAASAEGEPIRIGQAAVAVRGERAAFLDAITLAPGTELWAAFMAAICSRLGVREIHYGSRWNIEPPRTDTLARLPWVVGLSHRDYVVDVIALDRFPSWEAFLQSIHPHHRRQLANAHKHAADIMIEQRHGLGALRLARAVNRMRQETYSGKGLDFSALRSLAGLAVKIAVLGADAVGAVLRYRGEPYSGYFGAAFGPSGYYIHGGNRRSKIGLGHLLMLRQIEETYRRDPRGRFVMGFADAGPQAEVEGHRRFRFGFGAAPVAGSEIAFTLDPAGMRDPFARVAAA
jgi:hypothetical protein